MTNKILSVRRTAWWIATFGDIVPMDVYHLLMAETVTIWHAGYTWLDRAHTSSFTLKGATENDDMTSIKQLKLLSITLTVNMKPREKLR